MPYLLFLIAMILMIYDHVLYGLLMLICAGLSGINAKLIELVKLMREGRE